jgi:16S rRNA (cytosine967-C5)-methyltransferase
VKYFSHLNTAVSILKLYRGEQPFHHFLKEFFRQDKKYGSGDRRNISQLCYSYFRLGNSFRELTIEERVLRGLFLCSKEPNELLDHLKPEWKEATTAKTEEKCSLLNSSTDQLSVFPVAAELSDGVETDRFSMSHLEQPDLFIRIRPGQREKVVNKLNEATIEYQFLNDNCIAMPNATKIDQVLDTDKEIVIQDESSQRIGEMIPDTADLTKSGKPLLWDCCAASGGKSIMAFDKLGTVQLTVSDIRESMLANLKKRFITAGIQDYYPYLADLTKGVPKGIDEKFDLIIADVPCTGSGTWGRTPEQLCYFDVNSIANYSELQKKILSNIAYRVKKQGYLLYITCSVFKRENELMAEFIQQQFSLRLVKKEIFKGYENRADTMFAALLVRD